MSDQLNESGGADAFVFDDIRLREKRVKLGDKLYVLAEATGEAVRKYRAAIMAGVGIDNGKVVRMSNVADGEAVLVSECLYAADETWRLRYTRDGSRPDPKYLAGLPFVQGLRYEVLSKLYDWTKEVSEIDPPEDEASLWKTFHTTQAKLRKIAMEKERDRDGAEKNGRTPTPAGSV
jgi:hypothetical protein